MLGVIFLIVFSSVAAQQSPFHLTDQNRNELRSNGAQSLVSTHKNSNTPYIEKDENVVRLPVMPAKTELHKQKKKPKKVPKRTIQKIIKKNNLKTKIRKIYFQRTNKPTTKVDYEKFYGSEDQNYERTTTQSQNQRKRARKYNNKVTRYRLPFQSSQMKNNRRHKRDWSRELYILKKLDEAEFMEQGKDYDMVKTHAKRPW